MGNSISGGGGGNNTNNDNRPGNKYPLTPDSNNIQDGQYVCFYSDLNVEQINNICKSMGGIATITDLFIIISGARSSKTSINSRYGLKSIKLKDTDNNNDNEKDKPTTVQQDPNNDFDIQLDSNYYLMITTSLFESASKEEIVIKRSLDNNYMARIKIGSKYEKHTESYFDAYITDDFKNFKDSLSPINKVTKMKFFLELPAVPSIYFNLQTLQIVYNARYPYVSVYEITRKELSTAMSHINTVRNNANVMAIYYYDFNDKFLRDAIQQFAQEGDQTIETSLGTEYYFFSVGYEMQNFSKKTVSFKSRTINLKPNEAGDHFTITLDDKKKYFLKPKNISFGFKQTDSLYSRIPDNVTQIFPASQTIQFNRNDFRLYIGYIVTLKEIDIIGTLLNSVNLPTRKFILYCNSDVIGTYALPKGLFKAPKNGITNIEKLEDGVNISTDYYLTMGFGEKANTQEYDIVNPHGDNLNITTLRKNEIKVKQAIFGSHTGDMSKMGCYIPDSELILPTGYDKDDKLIIVCAMDSTPTAVWNMAKNLTNKFKRKNWILYFSIIETFSLEGCIGYTIKNDDKNMKVLYPNDSSLNIEFVQSSSLSVKLEDGTKILIFSQHYIQKKTRDEYIGAFSIYPGKVPASEDNYQQYKYSLVQNMSYIDYNIRELQSSLKDNFIGGLMNNITIYTNLGKLKDPIINDKYITPSSGMYFDYFPTMINENVMKSYLAVFEKFLALGSNSTKIRYTCLMRVRKEWVKKNPPNKTYFEIIEGKNPDYILIFMFGGTERRYKFNAATRTFSSNGFQSIVLNSEIAKSISTQPTTHIYIEDPLDDVIKPSDEFYFINIPFNPVFNPWGGSITSYETRDNLSFFIFEYNDSIGTIILNGSITQSNMSLMRNTYLYVPFVRFAFILSTAKSSETLTSAGSVLFIHLYGTDISRIEIPSLRESIEKYIQNTETSAFKNHSVVYDKVNKVYIIANVSISINQDSNEYYIARNRVFIRSEKFPHASVEKEDDLMLDMIGNNFQLYDENGYYIRNSFSVRDNLTSPDDKIPQVDKVSRKSTGVSIKSDNKFWNSIRAFVFINNLEKFEVSNLADMAAYLSVNLDGFFIISLVSYDITSPEKWMLDRCIVLRGNNDTPIEMSYRENKTYYYIEISDSKFANSVMKFGVWNTNKRAPTENDLTDIDFILNKESGTDYDKTIKIKSNERVGLVDNYINFTFPSGTLTSFPKFAEFCSKLNKYILFARPVSKQLELDLKLKDGIFCVDISSTNNASELDFSEVINFVVQWRAIAKNNFKYMIIRTLVNMKRPDKEYKITIDNLVYSTSDFTYTDNPSIMIFPRLDNFNTATSAYSLDQKVFLLNPSKPAPETQNESIVLYSSKIQENRPYITVYIGNKTDYNRIKTDPEFYHLNMKFYVHDIISKK